MIPGSGRSPAGGNGNSLQYSCLGNPMDRGEEPGKLWSMGSQRVGQDWATNTFTFISRGRGYLGDVGSGHFGCHNDRLLSCLMKKCLTLSAKVIPFQKHCWGLGCLFSLLLTPWGGQDWGEVARGKKETLLQVIWDSTLVWKGDLSCHLSSESSGQSCGSAPCWPGGRSTAGPRPTYCSISLCGCHFSGRQAQVS